MPPALAQLETDYGFAEAYWDVSGVPDGEYEIRARTECEATFPSPPDGVNEGLSETISGTMDRKAPRRFGLTSEPADGVYSPGDEMSVTFDESLVCLFGIAALSAKSRASTAPPCATSRLL